MRRQAQQCTGPAARDTESEAGLEISSYFPRLGDFFWSSGLHHLSSAWGLCKMKMQRWIFEATSLEWLFSQCQTSLPSPSLVILSKSAALRCQTDPGSRESALLLRHIREVSEEEPQELKFDFASCSSWDLLPRKWFFLLEELASLCSLSQAPSLSRMQTSLITK